MKLTGKRILIVEDEPVVAMLVEDILLDEGAEIVGPASSVAQAMKLAATAKIDAGFLDVNLNGEDSHGIAAKLRERGIPFVYATGYGTGGELNTNAPVIQKPYLPVQVVEVLERLMNGPKYVEG